MANKVYSKQSGLSPEERKMVRAIEKYVKAKLKQDPNFELPKANNLAELKLNYIRYGTEEASIVSETKNPPKPKVEPAIEDHTDNTSSVVKESLTTENKEDEIKETDNNTKQPMAEETEEWNDPLTRSNPNIREYVNEDSMKRPEEMASSKKESTGDIPEPTNFEEAFGADKNESANTDSLGYGAKQEKKKTPPPKQYEPINPNFDDMNKSKKNKQTKRFAKYIVEATAMLVEKGCIWWTTKDINDIKLAEYELEGTVNLEIMLTLSEEQQMTVRDFFRMQCQMAESAYAFTAEEKEELADALYDVMLERGLAPTPMQTLAMVALGIIGKRVFTAVITKVQINSILKNPIVSPPTPEEVEQPPAPQAPKQEAPKPPKQPSNVVSEDSREVDPEKVMTGEQHVGTHQEKPKRKRRPKPTNELVTA